MDHPLQDERLQFFLRHRDDIRQWAAIEREVTAAVRELLGRSQADIDERLAAVDPDATTMRHDGGRWERIIVRRPKWPGGVGITLEWETGVDPFGGALPKIGVFFLNPDPAVQAARIRLVEMAQIAGQLQSQGYKVNPEQYWPLLRRIDASRDWWRDVDGWLAAMVDRVVQLWLDSATLVDESLRGELSREQA